MAVRGAARRRVLGAERLHARAGVERRFRVVERHLDAGVRQGRAFRLRRGRAGGAEEARRREGDDGGRPQSHPFRLK